MVHSSVLLQGSATAWQVFWQRGLVRPAVTMSQKMCRLNGVGKALKSVWCQRFAADVSTLLTTLLNGYDNACRAF
jgi:phage tail tape-measure protein